MQTCRGRIITEAFQEYSPNAVAYPPLRLATIGGVAVSPETVESIGGDAEFAPIDTTARLGEVALNDDKVVICRYLLMNIVLHKQGSRGPADKAAQAEINGMPSDEVYERVGMLKECYDYGITRRPSALKPEIRDDTTVLLDWLSAGLSPQLFIDCHDWTLSRYRSREKSLYTFLIKAESEYVDKDSGLATHEKPDRATDERVHAQTSLDAMRDALCQNTAKVPTKRRRPSLFVLERSLIIEHTVASKSNTLTNNVEPAIIKTFVGTLTRFEDTVSEPRLSIAELQQATTIFLRDTQTLKSLGVRQPGKLALYHGPEIIDEVQAVSQGLFARSYIVYVTERSVKDPVQAMAAVVEKVANFRSELEPRLREDYQFDGQWSDRFISQAALRYADLNGYLRQWLDNRNILIKAYPDVKAEAIDKFLCNGESAALLKEIVAAVESEPLAYHLTEIQQVQGFRDLDRVRQARKRPDMPNNHRLSWRSHEFVRQLRANTHLQEGTELDITKTANYIMRSVRHYNETIAQECGEEEIGTDVASLLAIFNAYAKDIKSFGTRVDNELAQQVAKTVSIQEYDRLLLAYTGRMTATQFNRAILSDTRDLAHAVDTHFMLREAYRKALGIYLDDVDEDILTNIAIKWRNIEGVSKKARLFITNRQQLRLEGEFDTSVERWMIDDAAISGSLALARSRLSWIRFVESRRRQWTDRYLHTENSNGIQYDRLANTSVEAPQPSNVPRPDMRAMLDTWPNPLEADAVRIIFGLNCERTEHELMELLDITDLESYVYGVILPEAQRRMAQ